MANAQQILARKDDEVVTVGPDSTVLAAAQLMNDRHIGSLLVLAKGRLSGIFTERDVMRRIVVAQRDAASTTVAEVMTTPVACAAPHTTAEELRAVMREKRIRHIPVVDAGRVVGMISIGDLNRAENEVQARTIQYLEQYLSVP